MHLAALVVAGQRALGHLLHHGIGEVDDALFVGRRALHHNFEQVEQLAGVAAAQGQQGVVFGQLHLFLAEHRVFGQRLLHQPAQGVGAQWLQHIHLAAREQRGDDLKRGVFGGGPNQRHGPVFHRAQQRVLLRLAEAVNFVDEQHRAALPPGPLNYVAHVLHPRVDGRKGRKGLLQLGGQQVGQGGFAHAGRPPQNEAGQPARSQVAAQHAGVAH